MEWLDCFPTQISVLSTQVLWSEQVEEVLGICAEKISVTDFTVEQVVCLTREENPRTKSWKVSVPMKHKAVMVNPAMYPPGWSFRVFHPGPRRMEGGARPSQGVSPVMEGRDAGV